MFFKDFFCVCRGFENVVESTHKLGPEEVDFTAPTSGATPPSSDAPPTNIEEVVPGAPRADIKGTWSRETALRVEKFILEQIESLEDKVASASMQVPVSNIYFAPTHIFLTI